jgi:hypothetical protein
LIAHRYHFCTLLALFEALLLGLTIGPLLIATMQAASGLNLSRVTAKELLMNRILGTAFLALVSPFVASVGAEAPDEALLAEMKKCAVCQVMAEKPALMEHMTWETHKIDNGMLCIASVPKEHAKEFASLHAKLMQNVAKVKADLKQGEAVQLCSFCESMGELEKAGATQQVIDTATGAITLVTSTDPELVEKIHEQADKAIAEQKKLRQARPTTG